MLASIDIRIPDEAELQAVQEFRRSVLAGQPTNQSQPQALNDIDLSPDTLHVAAFKGDEIVGCVRFELKNSQAGNYFVSRMAVRPDLQGSGAGLQILKYGEKLALEQGGIKFMLDSRSSAVVFYEKMGYVKDLNRRAAKADNLPMVKVFQL